MAKTVSDLDLDDEHMTIGIDDSIAEASGRLLTMTGGILVVLDGDSKTTRKVPNVRNGWKWISLKFS